MVLMDTKECGMMATSYSRKWIQCVEFVSDRLSSACAPRWQRSECNCCAIMGGVRFETNVWSLGEREEVVLIKKGGRRGEEGKCWLGAMIGEEFQGEAQGKSTVQ
jgi:hypothetical protein